MKIDKSVFSAEEREQFEALIAKAKVNPAAAEEEMEDEKPEVPAEKKETKKAEVEDMEDTKKSVAPEFEAAMKAANERMEKLEKSIEMKEFSEIAKKYAPLGEKEEELAQTLYDMKKSSEAHYNAYINVLDKSLGLVEKSGVFAEIGKSASGTSTGSTVDKVEANANEIMKADPNMSRAAAIAKSWEDHPEWVKEYEDEYKNA